jgi:hypothetical protein
MAKPACPLAVLLFLGFAAGLFAQNVEITVERAASKVYSGFKERIYIDGKSMLTLGNGASGKISISPGEHTIYADLYTIKTEALRFNAGPGVKFVVTPYSLESFVIEQHSLPAGAAAAVPAGAPSARERVAAAADRMSQAFEKLLPAKSAPAASPPPAAGPPPAVSPAPAAGPAPAGNGVEASLERAADALMAKIPSGSKIAIVYVSARDAEVSEFISGELEFIMVGKGYTLIDRSELDRIRKEQALQMSGEVDDNQAVSIGKFAGADVIITGAVTGSGELRRLRLRALSTESAAVLAAASERY